MKLSEFKYITFIFSSFSFVFFISYQSIDKNFVTVLKPVNIDNFFGTVVKPLPKWPTYLEPTFGESLKEFVNLSNFANDDEREFVEYYLPVMIHRARMVGEYCNNHPEIVRNEEIPLFYWITRKGQPNITWCCNYKVGSGTWTINFLKEGNFNANNPKFLLLKPSQRERARFSSKYGAVTPAIRKVFQEPRTPEERLSAFEKSIRFLVVRHPFTRLLSSYRNIMERLIANLSGQSYFTEMRKLIVEKYRQDPTNNTSEFPTFPEFINYFIDITEGVQTYNSWRKFLYKRIGKNYWMPFFLNCNVCASDFTVVAKLETMNNDQRFIAIIGNLTKIRFEKNHEWRHKIENKTSFELAEKYYKQLTPKQMMKLYDVYKYDFKLFNYDIEDYLKISKH